MLRTHPARLEVQRHAAAALSLVAASSDMARSSVLSIPGTRGALVYFLIDQLAVIDHMYQYSLSAFTFIFQKARRLDWTP